MLIPFHKISLEFRQAGIHRDLKLAAPRDDLRCESARRVRVRGGIVHLGELLLHLEDQLGELGRNALVVLGELFTV